MTKKKETPSKQTQIRTRTLGEVARAPESDVEVMGVVLDCTGHYRTNYSYDFVTKIKLIDRTHNPTLKSTPRGIEPWVTACVFSAELSDAPIVTQIGDIVVLRSVGFNTFKGQVSCKVLKNGCEWAVFNGRPNAPKTPFSARGFTGLSKEQTQQLVALREWALHFFINNSLIDLGWYSLTWPSAMNPKATYQLKDADVIVKVLGSVSKMIDGKKYQKLVFCDCERQLYYAELSDNQVELAPNTVVKLRSVCLLRTRNEMRVDFYNYSALLSIPEKFRDAAIIARESALAPFNAETIERQFFAEFHLERYGKREISHNTFVYELDSGNGRVDVSALFPILSEFCYEPSADGTSAAAFVKHARAALVFSTLSELSERFAAARKSSAPRASFDAFRVRARIVKSESYSIERVAYLHSPGAKKTWVLGTPEAERHSDLIVIFHNVFYLQDDSLGARTLPCHLFTFDANPSYFFDLWKLLPDVLSVAQWQTSWKQLKSLFAQKLKEFVGRKPEGQFVVELQASAEGTHYYRIIDTICGLCDPRNL